MSEDRFMNDETSAPRIVGQSTEVAVGIGALQSTARHAEHTTQQRRKSKNRSETPLERFAHWRQVLRSVEIEAAKLKCVEVGVLVGVAMLAVDDLIKASVRSHNSRRNTAGNG